MKSSKISVVLPAYNESEHIITNVIECVETFETLGYDFEIIVVDDGSSDDTHVRAFEARMRHPGVVRVIRYDENAGKGNALMCGTRYASGDYVVFLDADMDLHPSQLPLFFEIMEQRGADAVIGSKAHPLSHVNYPPVRRLYSRIYYGLTRLLFGLPLRDTQTGLKVFKIEVLHQVFPRLLVKRFAFDIEMLANAHRLGYKLVDAPVTLTFTRRFSRVKFYDAMLIFKDTFAIFYRMKILRYYDRVGIVGLGTASNPYGSREVVHDDDLLPLR